MARGLALNGARDFFRKERMDHRHESTIGDGHAENGPRAARAPRAVRYGRRDHRCRSDRIARIRGPRRATGPAALLATQDEGGAWMTIRSADHVRQRHRAWSQSARLSI